MITPLSEIATEIQDAEAVVFFNQEFPASVLKKIWPPYWAAIILSPPLSLATLIQSEIADPWD